MPEIKNTFTQGKMNKDLDERLIPNGEYRDALNMQQAAYLLYLEQQRRRKAYLDNYRQMFLANKGGLAGLFRVKNV